MSQIGPPFTDENGRTVLRVNEEGMLRMQRADAALHYLQSHGNRILEAMRIANRHGRYVPPDIDEQAEWKAQIEILSDVFQKTGLTIFGQVPVEAPAAAPDESAASVVKETPKTLKTKVEDIGLEFYEGFLIGAKGRLERELAMYTDEPHVKARLAATLREMFHELNHFYLVLQMRAQKKTSHYAAKTPQERSVQLAANQRIDNAVGEYGRLLNDVNMALANVTVLNAKSRDEAHP